MGRPDGTLVVAAERFVTNLQPAAIARLARQFRSRWWPGYHGSPSPSSWPCRGAVERGGRVCWSVGRRPRWSRRTCVFSLARLGAVVLVPNGRTGSVAF